MIYTWYKIFNQGEFLATGLVSKTYTFFLINVGLRDILVTKGETVGMVYDDVFLSVNLNSKNPFEFEGYAVYISELGNVFLGIAVPDEN